jgi:hypothetical protein
LLRSFLFPIRCFFRMNSFLSMVPKIDLAASSPH